MFKELVALLDEYFGIDYGYFTTEIRRLDSWSVEADSPDIEALESDKYLLFVHSIDFSEFSKILNIVKEEDDSDINITHVLFLLAHIIKDKDYFKIMDFINEMAEDYLKYRVVREDLLKLYVWLNDPKTKIDQKLTLKHAMGNIEIENFDGWFTRNLLEGYLDKYLSDITTIEQAESELLTYKGRKGRKVNDRRVPVIMYGIFRMLNDQKKMKSPQSDSLCKLIIEYLKYIGVFDDDTNVDNQWIRAQLKYISTKPEPPKFERLGVLKKTTLEEMEEKNTGRKLY
jgi:hypothetical protein